MAIERLLSVETSTVLIVSPFRPSRLDAQLADRSNMKRGRVAPSPI
ncbi:hypothetical protein COLSTE_02268 [Collinsella stercoris DSM 13279]|uniref:Uncharacterized protein n=1 Tax=Collinsella stercoris DSM 13279 TaxID=445975 RepID=B6GDT4_9ACTN|nr:hypothetical protein COLSTE_02268 [Collinsella stercoris DSM 13279]